MTSPAPLAAGSTIGILGGGQLGRMLALAAAPLGYHVHIYAPETESVAAEVAQRWTRAGYDDQAALAAFAASCAVVTYEFENVPADAVAFLEALVPVHPRSAALRVSQDRLPEKQFVRSLGGGTAPFHAVSSQSDLERAVADLGLPAILKTRRFGYDGKGQVRLHHPNEVPDAFRQMGGDCILEGFVSFQSEFSILIARGTDGATVVFPPCQNRHEQGILAETRLPAIGLSADHAARASQLGAAIAARLDYVGLLACEFFDCADGPLFNEMAPRVHNSGHWSIEGANASQFEQHIRAIAGLPLPPVVLTAPHVEMQNLIGDAVRTVPAILADPTAHLHLYGKHDVRPGRKMGHVTRIRR